MTAALLSISRLTVSYGSARAVRDFSLELNAGGHVGLLGLNGAGKTTVLRAISGLARVESGHITFEGERLDGLRPASIARRGISHVPQGRRCFPGLSVKENLMMGGYYLSPRELKARQEFVYSLFPVLAGAQHRHARELSGGQQQMVAIGRGLISNPRLLLLDEASVGLAPIVIHELGRALGNLSTESSTTILMAEQTQSLVFQVTSRYCVLRQGALVQEGMREDIQGRLVDLYMGESEAQHTGFIG